ncbi:MAG: hypothetical protein IIC72_10845 [Acidobacteria bacterium]|nr:hypothetical protein [Acidobacteriota bacterium]
MVESLEDLDGLGAQIDRYIGNGQFPDIGSSGNQQIVDDGADLFALLGDRSQHLGPVQGRRLFPPRFPRPNADGKEETEQFDELVEWVRRRGRVGEDAARLVVMFDVRAAAFGSWRVGLLSLV